MTRSFEKNWAASGEQNLKVYVFRIIIGEITSKGDSIGLSEMEFHNDTAS